MEYEKMHPHKLVIIIVRLPKRSRVAAPTMAAIMEKMGLIALMSSCLLGSVIPADLIISGIKYETCGSGSVSI